MAIPPEPAVVFNGWTCCTRLPQEKPYRLCLLLHGWTGDENSMWVYAPWIPDAYALLAPRAPHVVPMGGYSWRPILPGNRGLPSVQDLRPAADAVISFVDAWLEANGQDLLPVDLVGFSQGGALSYVLALLHPQRVRAVAVLSGFLPDGAEPWLEKGAMQGRQVFLSHGKQDTLIPMERCRQAMDLLKRGGAETTCCESNTGHKTGKACILELEAFFRRMI